MSGVGALLPVIVPFAALWAMMAHYLPTQENSDGLLQTIIASQKLTVFFWGQDRFGNLLPALTVWINNPVANAYAQISLRILAGLLAPCFFCSLALDRPLDIWRATPLSSLLLVSVIKPALGWEIYIEASPYAPSLVCCGLAAMALSASAARRGGAAWAWRLLGIGLLLTGYVVNFAQIVLALPLIGLLALVRRSRRLAWLLFWHVVAAAFGFAMSRRFGAGAPTDLGASFDSANFARYWAVLWLNTGWRFALAIGAPVVLFVLAASTRWRDPAWRASARVLASMLAVLALFFVIVALSKWLAMNAFDQRYFVPGYLLLSAAGGIALWHCVGLLVAHWARSRAWFAGVTLALLIVTFAHLRALDLVTHEVIGDGNAPLAYAAGERAVELPLDAIAGDYWLVWPSVFMAEQFRYNTDANVPDVLGITFRGDARRDAFMARLRQRGTLRVGCIDLDAAACARFAATFMTAPDLRGEEFAPVEALPAGHALHLVKLLDAP